FRIRGKAQPQGRGANRGRLVAYRPALFRTEPAAGAGALRPRISNHQLAVPREIAMSELAPEAMQRMVGVRDRDKAQPHQWIAKEAGRHARADRDVHIAPQKRFIGAAEHGFVELDSRLGTLLRESRQAL